MIRATSGFGFITVYSLGIGNHLLVASPTRLFGSSRAWIKSSHKYFNLLAFYYFKLKLLLCSHFERAAKGRNCRVDTVAYSFRLNHAGRTTRTFQIFRSYIKELLAQVQLNHRFGGISRGSHGADKY